MDPSAWAMEALGDPGSNGAMMTTTAPTQPSEHRFEPDPAQVTRAIAKRSFCTLATVSPAGRPHVAAVLYELVGDALFVSTLRSSRKARNLAANPHVGVCIPVRRLPVGPPSSVTFQGRALLCAVDGPEVAALFGAGHLRTITGHGELELPDACILRIDPPARLVTYGLGMSLRRLARDPLHGAGTSTLLAGAG